MGSSSVGTTGNALVAAIAGMTDSSKNKLRDVARKATLARLLDDGSSASSTNNDGGHTTDKENSSRGSAVGRGLSSSNTGHVFSERSNINNKHNDNSTSSTGAAGTHTNHVNLEALRNLRDLCSIVSEVERRMAVLRDTIDSHRRDNAARREMSEITRQQTAQLAATLAALPEHLPHAAPTKTAAAYGADATAATAAARSGASVAVSAPAYTRTGANRRGANPAAVGGSAGGGGMTGRVSASDLPGVPVLELVTVAELNGVPRSTRARLTIEQINGAVAEIQKAVERRQAFLSRPRKKLSEKQRSRLEELLQQEVPAHGGEPFIAEPDLRALPAFKKGEMTAKAMIATLRSLKRLKGVRGAGMMTYVVQGG